MSVFKSMFKSNSGNDKDETNSKSNENNDRISPNNSMHSSSTSVKSDRIASSITEMSFRGKSSLARLLGIRWVCNVDQNTFFRDKIVTFGTFGYASKKAVSGVTVVNENQLGTRWRPRIMVISTCSVVLFGINKYNNANNKPLDTDDEISKLMAKTGELKISIAFEDIHYITKSEEVKNCIYIRSSQVNGDAQTTVVRATDESQCETLLKVLEDARIAFQAALKALKGGQFEKNRQMFSILQFTIKDNELEASGTTDEKVVRNLSIFRKTIPIGPVKRNETIQIYLSHPHQCGIHRVILNQMNLDELATKAKTWIPGDPMILGGDDAVESVATKSEAQSSTSPQNAAKAMEFSDDDDSDTDYDDIQYPKQSMSLRVLVTYEDREMYIVSGNQNQESNDDVPSTVGKLAGSFFGNKTILVSLNAMILVHVVLILMIMLMPMDFIGRREAVTILLIPLISGFVYSITKERGQRDEFSSDSGPQKTMERYYFIKLYDARLGLVDELKDSASQDETSEISVENSKQVNSEGKIGHLRGIEGVLAALDVSKLDGNMSEDDVPYNWFEAVNEDRTEALRRWIDSLEWRRRTDVENILTKPQPHFFKIKNCWPQYFLGIEKEGNLVTLEKFRGLDKICRGMKKKGVTPDDFASHCVFLNEYWIKNKLAPYGKLIKILDVSGLAFGLSIRVVIDYFSRMNADMQQYPEILNKCYIVNVKEAGSAFRFIFRLLPRFLEERTFEKIIEVKDVNSSDNPLLKIMSRDQLPVELGGTFTGELKTLKLEEKAANYAREINRKCGILQTEEDWKT
mmetsp:Transcript_13956/g.18115  ORF Transcript_13956/g.18115 Transcript_13956/m.18115 type:complete len:801 (+) Transcript_13956:292-2694(+)